MAAVAITRLEFSAAELRAKARLCGDARPACRMLSLAMVLDGASREDAARAGGMDRQTLRDWIHRYNASGLGGLADQPRSGRPARLSWVQQGKVARWLEEGADIVEDGVVRFRRIDLQRRIAKAFGIDLHERSVGKLLHRLGYRRISARPLHPQTVPEAQEAFKKTLPSLPRTQSAPNTRTSRSRSGFRTKQGSASRER